MTTLANIARRLNLSAAPHKDLPPIVLITDEHRLPDPFPSAKRLPRGSGILFRHYNDPRREDLAIALLRLCRRRHLKLLIAGNWRLAAKIGADGTHLPAWMVRRIGPMALPIQRRPGFLVTAAAHSPRELNRAKDIGADAVFLSPIFATASHPKAQPLGILRTTAWAKDSDVSVYALGGIGTRNGRRLFGTAFTGIAGISGIS